MSSFEIFSGQRGRVVAGLLVAEFTAATQSLVVTTVMPKIASDLHGLALYGFAYGALLGASLLSMALAGPAADRYGTYRVLVVAFTLALIGLIGSMSARSMPWFVGSRALEGLGGGLDYVVSVAAIAKLFPEDLRPRVFAWISGMWVVPGLVGPSLGATIAALFGWRWIFAIFAPLVVLSAALVLPALRRLPSVEREAAPVFGTARGTAIAAFAALQAAFFGADAYVSLLLTGVRGLSIGAAGVCITLAVVGWTIGSTLQPRVLSAWRTRGIAIAGSVFGIVALAMMISVTRGAPVALAYAGWFVGGVGIGLAYATLTLAALHGLPKGSEGAASSATLVAGVLGSTIGVTVCGLPVTIAHRTGASLDAALSWSFSLAMLFAIVLFVLSLKIENEVV